PGSLRPGAATTQRVTVTDLNGKPADAEVIARVLAADDRELYKTTGRPAGGTLVVSLPPELATADAALRLDVTAVAADARAHVQDPLRARPPERLTHLAVPKLLSQPGDVLFFRSLTLDRFTHAPAAAGREVVYTLRDSAGQVLHELVGELAAGGLGGGA